MRTKQEKVKFVQDMQKEMKRYKVVGVVSIDGLPDRLVQSMKNRLKPETRFIMARKKLLQKILEAHDHGKELSESIQTSAAIILSNEDAFELYNKFKANVIKLSAKPGQIAPDDVHIESGETSIMPGQTVTELKSAGIDVQIQKGKVVIAKDKILVKKGEHISLPVAKALHTLEITPFSAVVDPLLLAEGRMLYTRQVLGINTETTTAMLQEAFRSAVAVSMDRNIVNQYTINSFITKAYNSALYLGLEAKILDSGIVEGLIARVIREAGALNSTMTK